MSNPKPNHRPADDPYTCSTTDLQEFIDPPGGAPLEEGLARPRHGRPADRQPDAPSNSKETSHGDET